jgi:protocatechuate 3,4-dioxygenase beta subunit
MLIYSPRSIALILVSLIAVALGAGDPAHASATSDGPGSSPTRPSTPAAAKPDDASVKPAPGRMFVVGRVLDPKGLPVPGATIMVYTRSLPLGHAPYLARSRHTPIGHARADGSGRFRIDAPRTSSSLNEMFGAVALAPGHGVGWVELDPDDDRPTADIVIRPEQVIHGRLFDPQGQPVSGVTVSVSSVSRDIPQGAARGRRRFDGVGYWGTKVNDFPAWPRPVMTDSEGRFTLRGVGRDLHASLAVHHPRFAYQTIGADTDGAAESKTLSAGLAPAQIVNVRVTYADTGQPVPHASLRVMAIQGRIGKLDESETDAEGRARVNSWMADRSYNITAYPPEGEPYLVARRRIEWPKGALEQSIDIDLPQGVPIHGKVTEEGSGKPVAGAMVEFAARGGRGGQNPSMFVHTASDGSFQLGAEASPGNLFVLGPGDDYVLQTLGSRMLAEGQPGGGRFYAHGHAFVDLKPGIGGQEVNVVLRRGATVYGRVVGTDGRPVRDAWIIGRIFLEPSRGVWRSWAGREHRKVHDGRFEIHGLEPDAEVPVYFLDPNRKLGGVVNLSGNSAAGGRVTVRLEPCGAVKARVVDPAGNPVAKPLRDLMVMMVVTPGPSRSSASAKAGVLRADEDNLSSVDPVNYPHELSPDAGGRITLPVLIPGATYRVLDYTAAIRGQTGPEVRKEFTVKPGETVDLGDIRVEKPPR